MILWFCVILTAQLGAGNVSVYMGQCFSPTCHAILIIIECAIKAFEIICIPGKFSLR